MSPATTVHGQVSPIRLAFNALKALKALFYPPVHLAQALLSSVVYSKRSWRILTMRRLYFGVLTMILTSGCTLDLTDAHWFLSF